ncbi:MAG: hypothetical protein DAHOPDDO_00844 [Ignavibacteriaceae bacterium]|nr:hypothetical protein [Ignavibacteriaceae bacterium]
MRKLITILKLVVFITTLNNSHLLAEFTVIIDPGHGGYDPGAGPSACNNILYEKDFNLDYAVLTYDNIFWTVWTWFPFITRDDDTFISLADRASMANNQGGNWYDAKGYYLPAGGVDFFLSIHCNSSTNPDAHGTEALYYEDYGVRGDRSITCATITLLYYLEYTKQEFTYWDSRWIKHQDVYVLRETDMPATLIETEFLSNSTSCWAMTSPFYKMAVLDGLSKAVKSIFPDEPDYVMKVITSDLSQLEWWYSGTFIFQNSNNGQEQYYYVENQLQMWNEVTCFIDDNVHVATRYGGSIINNGAKIVLGENSGIDVTVGIEDYIWIDLEYDYYNVNQTYVGANTRTFVDVYPYGDYIVSWGPWKIEALHGCGRVLVFETQYNGYINIPPLPDGYLWQRDANGRVIAYVSTSGIDNTGYNHYAEVQMAIGNVPNTFITSGTLTSNTNWRGCVTITGNITVPSGITLTIHPDAVIIFQNNSSLIVNGTLNAQSCELNGGFLNNWGSVTFSGSGASNSVLNNVVIKNGVGIRCLNGANVAISNSMIDHCTEGVYFYNSQPSIQYTQIIEPVQNGINGDASGLLPLIINNTIAKTSGNPQYHQYQGIILGNNTNGYIAHNDISGFMWGMYIGGGSDAYFTNYTYQLFNPNNRVRDNSVGVGAGWGGYIMAGTISSYGRNNSIYNNYTNDARSYKNSVVYAQCNWWGNDGAQIYKDATSTLDVQFPLASDPWNQGPPPGEEGMNIIINNNDSPDDGDGFNPDSSVLAGIYLEAQERIVEAVLHYKQMVMNDNHPGFALGRLVGIKNRYNIQNIRNYLENLLIENRPYKPIVMTLFAGILLGEDKYNLAMLLYSQIINQYPNTYYSVNALFEKFFAALNYENDRVLAEQLLQELIALGLTDEEFIMRLQIAENLYNTYGLENFTKSSYTGLENTESEIDDHYSLSENFPNPFNPTTSIKYQIPKAGNVTLKIYDILGNEVANLVNEFKETGRYEVNFNASNLASGVYIYRLSVNDFINVKKMVLLK